MRFYVKPTQIQMALYNIQLQLAWNSMLGAKPSHNLANVWNESITRPGHLISLPPPPRTHPEELRWGNSMPVSQVHTDRALSGLKIIIEKAGRVRYKRCPACICSSWQPARGVWSGPSAAQSHRWGVMLTRLHLGGPREKKKGLKTFASPRDY